MNKVTSILYKILSIGFLLLFIVGCSTSISRAQEKTPKSYKKYLKKHRKQYKKNFLTSAKSPLDRKGVKKLTFFKANINYKVQGTFKKTPNEKPFDLVTYSGMTKKYVKYGEVTFQIQGKPASLAVYQSIQLRQMPMYKDLLFVPFKDATSNQTTYGGGRYIDAKLTDIVGDNMTIDFNKAYNPYCAYQSEGWNCPIPPAENHLEVAIEAGEKMYKK